MNKDEYKGTCKGQICSVYVVMLALNLIFTYLFLCIYLYSKMC